MTGNDRTTDLLIGNPMVFRDMPLEDALRKMVDLGFDALELWPPQIEACRTEALCRQLVEFIDSLGLKALRLNVADRPYFQSLQPDMDDQSIVDGLKGDIDLAAALGMPQLLTWEGRRPNGLGHHDQYGWLLDRTAGIFEQAVAYGRTRNVELSVEVHPFTLGMDLDWIIALCDRIHGSDFGIAYDCCHFAVGLPEDYIHAIHRLGKRIKHVHFCDSDKVSSELHFAPGTGCLDLEGIVEALKTIGFEGTVMLDLWLYPLPELGSRMGVPYTRKVMARLGL